MQLRSVLSHYIIACYIAVTLAGFLFATLRIRLPFVPAVLRSYAYQMMAPYQGYGTEHQDFYAEGILDDGTRVAIDLDRSFPFSRAERYVRSHLSSSLYIGGQAYSDTLRDFAEDIFLREHKRLPGITAIEFGIEQWPLSSQGYATLRMPPWSYRDLTVVYP